MAEPAPWGGDIFKDIGVSGDAVGLLVGHCYAGDKIPDPTDETTTMAMINDSMVAALNEQVRREFQAAQNYLAMAVHLDGKSLEYLAAFFYRQADEEREHAMKLVSYLLDLGHRPAIPAVELPPAKFEGIKDIIQASLVQEQGVTAAIHELVDAALNAKDHATYQFLLWFVDEQVEEEASFGRLLDIVDMSENVLQVEHYVRHMATANAGAGEDEA